MKITIWPTSGMGFWSAFLSVIFFILFYLETRNIILIPSIGIAAIGLVGFFRGTMSIIQDKERSILAFLSIPAGVIVIFRILSEIINSQ
ncbi:hypothetical protein [Dehalobacterium formicoaceticum]|uniref:Uncharacterized protein n=1 Tax=Dehalobacterium formicoaceticum TaxID=51515 RepID=A0ABT1Y521_9FIRM|nr:hypothetical protein [Dehalobacterium formicoaceticum]MCR6545019.1 hypothetical protein [Dehalobacterium formicoaceticum]